MSDVCQIGSLYLFKVKVFSSKGYDVWIYCPWRDQQILPCDSNFIIHAVMRPKFGNFYHFF